MIRWILVSLAFAWTAWGCPTYETIEDGGSDSDGAHQNETDSHPDGHDSGPLITGRSCAKAQDCGSGYDCYLESPGGYCLSGDAGGPTACRDPEHPCPAGTTCSPLPWHQISGVCMLTCIVSQDCRNGYRCDHVELFPGEPNTPISPNKVCWTVCQFGADQTCNDNPSISSLHGACLADGTCKCKEGFEKNPDTGRCR